jgi:hypothetical protein
MNRLTQERLTELVLGTDLEIRSYSGRGMYGKQCVAVTGESVNSILSEMMENCDSGYEAAQLLRESSSDSKGRDVVVYWPRSRFEEEQDDGELKDDEI